MDDAGPFHGCPAEYGRGDQVIDQLLLVYLVPLQVGQTFTIEPIFVEGSNKVTMWKDDWTATTTDGGLAAQCEHTVLITPSGCEVLTVA